MDNQNPLDVGDNTYDSQTNRWVPKTQTAPKKTFYGPNHWYGNPPPMEGVGVGFGDQIGEAINSIPWNNIPLLGGAINRTQGAVQDLKDLPQNIKTFQETPQSPQPYINELMNQFYSNPTMATLSDQKNPITKDNLGQKAQAMALMGGMADIQPIQGGWVQSSQANPNLQPYIDAAKTGSMEPTDLPKGNLTPDQIMQYHSQTLPKSQIETAIANGQFGQAKQMIDSLPPSDEYKQAAQQLLETIIGARASR